MVARARGPSLQRLCAGSQRAERTVGNESSLRQRVHDLSLVFVGALGVYLLSVLLAGRLAPLAAAALRESSSLAGRVLLGALVEGVSRLPWLLIAAAALASATRLSTRVLAVSLLCFCFALDAAVIAVLGQAGWMLLDPLILGCRVAVHVLLGVAVALLVARRRRRRATA